MYAMYLTMTWHEDHLKLRWDVTNLSIASVAASSCSKASKFTGHLARSTSIGISWISNFGPAVSSKLIKKIVIISSIGTVNQNGGCCLYPDVFEDFCWVFVYTCLMLVVAYKSCCQNWRSRIRSPNLSECECTSRSTWTAAENVDPQICLPLLSPCGMIKSSLFIIVYGLL